jgi:lipopolysaccharide/colanic/teichoic acid biosynthesis glycosyltransferase
MFFEKSTGQILADQITPHWFLFADLKLHFDEVAVLKRASDLIVATVGLLVLLPLLPFIALAIALDDRGPLFYSQDRVGQNGRIFRLFKIRTMRTNAENGESLWATRNDPRVTRVGRFLRRTRLDEFPQFLNVLLGQMSIVGPRPERPDIVQRLSEQIPYYAERHLAKPGITGWAQISFRYGSSVADARRKLQFDLFYLKHACFELDLIILLRTLGTFLRGAC